MSAFGFVAALLLARLAVIGIMFLALVVRDENHRRSLRRRALQTESGLAIGDDDDAEPTAESGFSSSATGEDDADGTDDQQATQRSVEASHSVPGSEDSPATPDMTRAQESPRRRRLQKLLNQGVELERNAGSLVGALAVIGPRTTQADVEAWEAAVEAELMDLPRERALFFYERPQCRSPR